MKTILLKTYLQEMIIYIHTTGWARKKFPLLKIHNSKSISQIWMISILVKSQKVEVFLWFFSLSHEHYKYR